MQMKHWVSINFSFFLAISCSSSEDWINCYYMQISLLNINKSGFIFKFVHWENRANKKKLVNGKDICKKFASTLCVLTNPLFWCCLVTRGISPFLTTQYYNKNSLIYHKRDYVNVVIGFLSNTIQQRAITRTPITTLT